MGILIGMDEAGYGPHLGPLVVAASAWYVPDEIAAAETSTATRSGRRKSADSAHDGNDNDGNTAVLDSPADFRNPKSRVDLYRVLRSIVAKSRSDRRIAIADSKVLYAPGLGLRQLERGLHAVLLSMRQTLSCWSEIVQYCGADLDGHHARVCWPERHDCSLPVDATSVELRRLEARLTRLCDATGVRPLLIRARLVFPQQFNQLIDHYDNKATALSNVTIGLLREVMDAIPALVAETSQAAPIFAVCDKHGGRNFYTAILQHHFSEHWIAPVFESHAESHYEWGQPEAPTRVVFQMNGERFMPTALASMTAKYLRELSMQAFNKYWQAHIPEIKPTAGYYRDAWRFKKEIAAKQKELGIEDYAVWRTR
jgi:ribonuclease HII